MAEKIMLITIMVLLISVIAETLRLCFKNGIFQPLKCFRQVMVWKSCFKPYFIKKTGQCEKFRKVCDIMFRRKSGKCEKEVWNSIWQGRVK